MLSEVRHYRVLKNVSIYTSLDDKIEQVKRQSKCPKHRYLITSTLSRGDVLGGGVTFQCAHCSKIVNASRGALASNIYLGQAYQRGQEYRRNVTRSR